MGSKQNAHATRYAKTWKVDVMDMNHFTLIMNEVGILECGAAWTNERLNGGYTNDKRDAGGETKWGISKRAYPELDIPNLKKPDAIAIYYRDYWLPSGSNNLAFDLAAVNFDCAVNQGLGRAKKWLAACEGSAVKYMELRRNHYLSLRNPTYEKGWLNRLSHLKTFILEHVPNIERCSPLEGMTPP